MDFDGFMETAWNDHADDPAAVAQRLDDGAALAADESQLVRLAALAHHVHGAHLGDWQAGAAFIGGLAASPAFAADGVSGQGLRRCVASLALAAGEAAALAGLAPSDRIRVGAMAAANLAERDTPRAMRLFEDALHQARGAALPADDPMNRALAVAGNNLAASLEEKPERSADERALMLLAAGAAREYWERAGTWLETERAEYRLAMSWLKAGDAARARTHAQRCLAIVAAHGDIPLERFCGFEALALAERAAGDREAQARAVGAAREAFAALDAADKTGCAATLDALDGRGAAA